jgi:hypothetical protein
MRQLEKIPNVEAISLDNIDMLSQWGVEYETTIMEEAPKWLEEEKELQQAQGTREEEGQ